ncbi:MAG: adenylate/guanylate cyclase domain-containing protein [Desulfobacteraceae bacterium]|jgi:adenylate cyclase
MNTKQVKRKLAAIFSADVKGYSRLMGEDEVTTVHTLEKYRELMSGLVQQHRGRVVDSPGDNLLAEFTSVVDAVEAAVRIQRELEAKNAELPANRRMEFRIGINLGDVIEEGDRIYGDGVNIAARVEGLAEGGGICISGTVYDHIENKIAMEYEYLGERTVKNIRKPVRVYRVKMRLEAAIPSAAKDLKLPDKPSIAVLPFVNMSDDPRQEYFSDGMTEDLITDLSKISGLFVIARNSVFTYKGKAVKVEEVGRELGVRYVLEGSVRKANDRVRITAQLVDAVTGGHLWAERYDRDLQDIFALQDEVTQKIVTALAVKVTEDEQERLARKYTDDMEAYDHYLRGLEYFYRLTEEANVQARQMFERAVDSDPEFSAAYAYMGYTHWAEWSLGWSQDPESLERAFGLAQKAIALDDSLPEAHTILGEVYLWRKQHEQAIADLKRSVALNPNYADAIVGLGNVLNFAGRPEEAIELAKKGIRLNPIYPVYYLWTLAHAYFLTRQHGESIEAFKRALNRNPNFHPAHVYLAILYIELGREDEAKTEWLEFVERSPQTTPEAWKQRLPYKDPAVLERLFTALGKAALA